MRARLRPDMRARRTRAPAQREVPPHRGPSLAAIAPRRRQQQQRRPGRYSEPRHETHDRAPLGNPRHRLPSPACLSAESRTTRARFTLVARDLQGSLEDRARVSRRRWSCPSARCARRRSANEGRPFGRELPPIPSAGVAIRRAPTITRRRSGGRAEARWTAATALRPRLSCPPCSLLPGDLRAETIAASWV